MREIRAIILEDKPYAGEIPAGDAVFVDSAARFEEVLAHIFESEGGFSDHPRDNGKATKYGITTAALAAWRGQPVTKDQVKALTKSEAKQIYFAKYWVPCECDVLPAPFDMLVFNLAVNAGNFRSQDLFQDALNMLGFDVANDGDIGPETFSAMKRANSHDLVMAYKRRAERFYRSLGDFDVFGNGWLNRLNKFTKLALAEVPDQTAAEFSFAETRKDAPEMAAMENWPETATAPVAEKTAADKVLGGDRLLGYKTYLAIAAYGIVEALEAAGYIPTGIADIITPVIVSFGGIGFVSKVERYLRPVLTTIFGKR